MDEIDAENTDGFLLEHVGRIEHIDVQQDVIGKAPGLRLKAQPDPSMRVIGSGEVARGDGIHKGKEASVRPASLLQLGEQLGPLVSQHRFQALLRYVTRTGTVEIVADLLVVSGNSFRHRAGGASHDEKPAGDFLSGADFGEGTERGGIEINGERFVVSVEFFSGRHSQAPLSRPRAPRFARSSRTLRTT